MGFEANDPIVVHIHPETGPWSYDPRFDADAKAAWLEEHPDWWTDPDAPVVEEDDSYAKWTNEVLRTELTARGLDTEGKKAELVARLEADDAANAS